jgi:hypothetical protein
MVSTSSSLIRPAVALDIGTEDSCQLALNAFCGHGLIPYEFGATT